MELLSIDITEFTEQIMRIVPLFLFFGALVMSWYMLFPLGIKESVFFSVVSAICVLIAPISIALKCVGLVGSFSAPLFILGICLFAKVIDSHKHFMKTTSGLASFLRGEEYIVIHKEDLKYSDVLNKPNDYLESTHNWVQYVFPTDKKSKYNKSAPTIPLEELALLRKDKRIISNLQKAYERILDFYDNKYEDVKWITKNNHNFKRITRIIRCLRLFGLDDEANTFFTMIREKVAHEEAVSGKTIVSPKTIEYWEKANQKVEVEPIIPWIIRTFPRSKSGHFCPNCNESFEKFSSVCPKCNQKMSSLYYTYKKDGVLRVL